MIKYIYKHRVRYRECDPMGVVYHTHYADYFEAARTEAIRDMGLRYKSLEEAGIIMPVVNLTINYHRPCEYDDLLEITAIFSEPPQTRIVIDYEVRVAGDEKVRVTGQVTLCFVDAKSFRPIPAPEVVTHLFDSVSKTKS